MASDSDITDDSPFGAISRIPSLSGNVDTEEASPECHYPDTQQFMFSGPAASWNPGVMEIVPLYERSRFEEAMPWLNTTNADSLHSSALNGATSEFSLSDIPPYAQPLVQPIHRTPTPHSQTKPVVFKSGVESHIELNGTSSTSSSVNRSLVPHYLRSGAQDKNVCGICKKTLSRKNDLDIRHMEEQHKCPFPGCENILLKSGKDLEEHLNKKHESTRERFKCGICGKAFIRSEKLGKHFRDDHKAKNSNWEEIACPVSPCLVKEKGISGGTFFATEEDRRSHLVRNHNIEVPSEEASQVTMNDVAAGHKRPLSQGARPDPKRLKPTYSDSSSQILSAVSDLPTSAVDGTLFGDISYNANDEDLTNIFSNLEEASMNSEPTGMTNVTISIKGHEMYHLKELEVVQEDVEELNSRNIQTFYNIKSETLTLRGSCSPEELQKEILGLENHLRRFRFFEMAEDCRKHGSQNHPEIDVPVRRYADISEPIRPVEDAETLMAWNLLLLEIPDIMRKYITGRRYTASLVRARREDGTLAPKIEIQSPGGQSDIVRTGIRNSIANFLKSKNFLPIAVGFYQGWITRLAGSAEEDDDPPINRTSFPHQRRYWKKVGMGASIGMAAPSKISATTGGYIWLNGKKRMVSVSHFITEAKERYEVSNCKIYSPSRDDIQEMRSKIQEKLDYMHNDNKVDAKEGNDVPFEELDRIYAKPFSEEINIYEGFKKELAKDDPEYEIGSVLHFSEPNSLREEVRPPDGLQKRLLRMDWSVISVEHARRGRNFFRHDFSQTPSIECLRNEIMNEYGTGEECVETGEVKIGDRVHYVGKQSGFRRGCVTVRSVISDEAGQSSEWSMTLDEDSSYDVAGDSGAWLIRDDGKLVGLLWGQQRRSTNQLLFTPIQDVFADIERKTKETVTLPTRRRGDNSSSIAKNTALGVRSICRDHALDDREITTQPSALPLDVESERAVPMTMTKSDFSVTLQSGTIGISDRCFDIPSPVPSLSSSDSNSELPSPGPPSPLPLPQKDIDLANLADGLTIDNQDHPCNGVVLSEDMRLQSMGACDVEKTLRFSSSSMLLKVNSSLISIGKLPPMAVF